MTLRVLISSLLLSVCGPAFGIDKLICHVYFDKKVPIGSHSFPLGSSLANQDFDVTLPGGKKVTLILITDPKKMIDCADMSPRSEKFMLEMVFDSGKAGPYMQTCHAKVPGVELIVKTASFIMGNRDYKDFGYRCTLALTDADESKQQKLR